MLALFSSSFLFVKMREVCQHCLVPAFSLPVIERYANTVWFQHSLCQYGRGMLTVTLFGSNNLFASMGKICQHCLVQAFSLSVWERYVSIVSLQCSLCCDERS